MQIELELPLLSLIIFAPHLPFWIINVDSLYNNLRMVLVICQFYCLIELFPKKRLIVLCAGSKVKKYDNNKIFCLVHAFLRQTFYTDNSRFR